MIAPTFCIAAIFVKYYELIYVVRAVHRQGKIVVKWDYWRWFETPWRSRDITVKVRLHGTRQAARLARDMVQRDLLRGNSIYMEGSSRARLLHIIHVSAFLGLFWGRCSSKKTEATARDSMCRAAIINSNLYCRPGSQQSRVCCVQRVAM